MATRTKMTPFARLLLVLLFLVPAAYFVASYINNEDPIENIKKMIGMETSAESTMDQSQTYDARNGGSELDELRRENAELRRKVQDLEAQLRQLTNNSDGSNRQNWGN